MSSSNASIANPLTLLTASRRVGVYPQGSAGVFHLIKRNTHSTIFKLILKNTIFVVSNRQKNGAEAYTHSNKNRQ